MYIAQLIIVLTVYPHHMIPYNWPIPASSSTWLQTERTALAGPRTPYTGGFWLLQDPNSGNRSCSRMITIASLGLQYALLVSSRTLNLAATADPFSAIGDVVDHICLEVN